MGTHEWVLPNKARESLVEAILSLIPGNNGELNCSVVSHFLASRTVARQAPLSLGFSRQEFWSRLPFPTPGGFSRSRDQTRVSCGTALAGGYFTTSTTWEAPGIWLYRLFASPQS